MKEHYGFCDKQISLLHSKGIGIKELYAYAKHFAVSQHDLAPVSKISLFVYIDTHGDFSELNSDIDHIAMEIFNNLSSKEKTEILRYIEDMCDE